ncbi:hypothetical protein HMPREF0580_0855 [Mobiluncus mulieris ATCC 35239]|uniref:Uncharacterized protein n=1 Tax=Mobiluncus mulieris ATCC 35239 TaxID=871571 RepID=E0QPS8_9ACTO|nr:hypothetical protein HMPREF0580_0855 [Mobiluncus mulieris ATCC 35239]
MCFAFARAIIFLRRLSYGDTLRYFIFPVCFHEVPTENLG